MRTFGMRLPLRFVSPDAKAASADKSRVATILKPDSNSFGVVRLALALAVLVSHSFWYTSGSSQQEPLYALTGFTLGEHAVQVFFILSGILVAQSFARSNSVVQFVIARFLRIVPGLVMCVVATSLVIGLLMTTRSPQAFLQDPQLWFYQLKTSLLITAALPLPGVFETNPVAQLFNGSLWTLKYEVVCYAYLCLLGALNLFHPGLRRTSIVLIALFISACAWMLPPPDVVCTHSAACVRAFNPAQNAAMFAMTFFTGVLVYFLRDKLVVRWSAVVLLIVVAAVAIGTRWQNLTTALLLAYATLAFARVSFGKLTTWTRKNDLSFGLYIYAAPIQQAIVHTVPGIDPIVLSLAALCVALPCALVSWKLIEHPALRLKAKFRPAQDMAENTFETPEMAEATVAAAQQLQVEGLAATPADASEPIATRTGPDVASRLRLNRRTGPASVSYRHARGSLRVA
jgi:peptidoglycan/LPS O-acetylase OafA/YrhL